MMAFMAWMAVMIFIPVFAPSLPVLAWGEAMCGVSWGVFQVCLDFASRKGTLADATVARLFPQHMLPKSFPPY